MPILFAAVMLAAMIIIQIVIGTIVRATPGEAALIVGASADRPAGSSGTARNQVKATADASKARRTVAGVMIESIWVLLSCGHLPGVVKLCLSSMRRTIAQVH